MSAAEINCPTCARALPATSKFCGFDGTDLSLAKEGQASRKVCSVCGRFYPGYASFCAFDRSSLQVMKTQRELNQTSSGEFDGTQSVETQIVPVLPPATSTAQIAADDRLLGADSEAPYSDLIGKTIDKKYLIQSVLGEGGMAVVYRAHHVQMERTVVIKVMQGWLLSNRNSVERFERECKLTAKLNHPNIVSVYDVGLINGKEPYLVMEYIKGESLADKIHNSGALPYATT
ncbi:MAG: protein kinase, partial [Candidatus Obscuribacterales bacterium]|nr:protein kinase [Candidatus Obscuribacterales bacterium]